MTISIFRLASGIHGSSAELFDDARDFFGADHSPSSQQFDELTAGARRLF
jgi:hypothetical protein